MVSLYCQEEELEDVIAILGLEELSNQDRALVARGQRDSCPNHSLLQRYLLESMDDMSV